MRWQTLVDHLTNSGLRRARSVEIPEREYGELIALVSNGAASRRDLALKLAAYQAEPVEKSFRRLGDQASALARRFGKGDLRIVIDPGGVRLDHERFGVFFGELVHVVRNAVDHGIERPEERAAAGKPPEGTLKFSAALTQGELRIALSDDGGGIDWESIRRVAEARGLPHRTDAELLDALCSDGVTTRSEVTSVSGRGVGMAALKQRVLALHGTLAVESVRGRGTTWILRFPAGEREAFGMQSGIFAPRLPAALTTKSERS
jgi:two-component system chemotaxis sensor kinase CheA